MYLQGHLEDEITSNAYVNLQIYFISIITLWYIHILRTASYYNQIHNNVKAYARTLAK